MYKKLANKKPKVTTQIVFALHYMYFIQLTKKNYCISIASQTKSKSCPTITIFITSNYKTNR